MRYKNIREEELKNKIAMDLFDKFDCTEIIKNIDFAVKITNASLLHSDYLLWAEAKTISTDIAVMLTQLILTIGKARIHHEKLPPPFLGCFDCAKIAFIPFSEIQNIFYTNDFNWNVAPSKRETREFKLIYEQIDKIINDGNKYVFDFENDEKELKQFIRENFIVGKDETSKIKIDKNNFINIYNKWLETVKPTILVNNWERAKKAGIIDGDFYLADLLSSENSTLKEKLFVVLRQTVYVMDRHKNDMGFLTSSQIDFSDRQRAHTRFWAIYERPPKEEYWDYIIDRRDLLVPQDVRERKGSFYTPQIWVELSQKYIADVLGENWQDEYYIWDCAAGTGNLLAGLTNKYNIWASTLDKTDVMVMHDRIETGANLLKDHCFQFDFLNDEFEKLPKGLRSIINNEEKRKKLIVYINPPYAEATSTATRVGTKKNKTGVATENKTSVKFFDKIGKARNEIFAHFIARIYFELHGCKIGIFSTLKELVSPNFKEFRNFFLAKLKKGFIVPANSFDNVNGNFQIGFNIWDLAKKERFKKAILDIYDAKGNFCGKKTHTTKLNCKYINDWIKEYRNKADMIIAKLCYVGSDFQNNTKIQICSQNKKIIAHDVVFDITMKNLIVASIYFAVRRCIEHTWINHRDQFLFPNDGWKTDKEFQNDCLAYTLFNNNISSKYGVNHWIPFIEYDVGAQDNFESRFMTDFIAGNAESDYVLAEPTSLFYDNFFDMGGGGGGYNPKPRKFSKTAQNVFKAGRVLWRYYHAQPNVNVNASYYDIREHFQGRNARGTMNNKSDDEKYNELIDGLRSTLKELAAKIEPKVYEYGFLKQ